MRLWRMEVKIKNIHEPSAFSFTNHQSSGVDSSSPPQYTESSTRSQCIRVSCAHLSLFTIVSTIWWWWRWHESDIFHTHNTYDTRDDRTNEWKRYEFYLFLNFSCYIYHITAYHRINHTQTAYLCCSNNNFHSFDAFFFYFFLSSCCNSILTITQNSTPNLSIKLSFVWFIFIPDVKMTI